MASGHAVDSRRTVLASRGKESAAAALAASTTTTGGTTAERREAERTSTATSGHAGMTHLRKVDFEDGTAAGGTHEDASFVGSAGGRNGIVVVIGAVPTTAVAADPNEGIDLPLSHAGNASHGPPTFVGGHKVYGSSAAGHGHAGRYDE